METKELIIQLIESGEFHTPKIKTLIDERGKPFYEMSWQKTDGTGNSVTSISITFKFDMGSFLSMYENMYPEHKIKQEFVLKGIRLFFIKVATYFLSTGKENYIELAKVLNDRKIKILENDYGV